MGLSELFEKYLGFLWETFMYDMDVYSRGYMYYLFMIPVIFYTIFFCVKWGVLLSPFYIPFLALLKSFVSIHKK